MGGQVMANASSQTIRIMMRANRLERRLREYVSGLVTAKYLSDGREGCKDLRYQGNTMDVLDRPMLTCPH